MPIVFGWKVVFKVIGTGVFACPNCGSDRNYERRRAQKFFTLFWIPLIPLKVIGEIVRCTYCRNDFRLSVLERPTGAQFTDLLQNSVRGVMVNILRRGAWNHPAARALAVQEITLAGTVGYTEANLDADFQVVPEDLSPVLGPLAGQLPQSGREALVAGAARVAAVDGPIQPAERQLIELVGAALGMTEAHVAGVVAQIAPGSTPAAPPYGYAQGGQAPDASGFGQGPVQDAVPFDPANMPTQAIRVSPPQGSAQQGFAQQGFAQPGSTQQGFAQQVPAQPGVPMQAPPQMAAPVPMQDAAPLDPADMPTHVVRIPQQQANDITYPQQQ